MAKMAFGAKGSTKSDNDADDTQIRMAAKVGKGKGKLPAFLTVKAKFPKGKKP